MREKGGDRKEVRGGGTQPNKWVGRGKRGGGRGERGGK